MSDFDKEAEREKLRQQFEREKEKRRATQQMSELLLKGATMTNKHCDTCGNPIFRQDGQEFCPNCQAQAQRQAAAERDRQAQAEQQAQTEAQAEQQAQTEAQAEAQADRQARAEQSRTAPRSAAEGPGAADVEGAAEFEAGAAVDAGSPAASRIDDEAAAEPTPATRPAPGDEADLPTPVAPSDQGSLDAAQSSLVATLTKYAAKAQETDDPRRAREYLQVAHEAADALAALRR